jgi:hypothetical protein
MFPPTLGHQDLELNTQTQQRYQQVGHTEFLSSHKMMLLPLLIASTPFVTAYPWSSGFGTKYSNPATLPANNGLGVDFTTAGDAIAVAHYTSPFISAYPWSSGFGTKYANPATLPANGGKGVAFNPAGNAVAMGHQNTPYIAAYPWSVQVSELNTQTQQHYHSLLLGVFLSTQQVTLSPLLFWVLLGYRPIRSQEVSELNTQTHQRLPTGNGYGVAFTK